MKLGNNYLRLSSITLLLAVTISLAAPSAFAMPGLGTGTTPPIPVQSQTVFLDFTGSSSFTHNFVSLRVYEAGLTPVLPADKLIFVNPCNSDFPGAVAAGSTGVNGLRVWDLMHSGVVAQFEITANLDMLSVSFGNGLAAQVVNYNGIAITAVNIDDAGVGAFHWEQIADSPSPGTRDDNTSILTDGGLYTVFDCGDENASLRAFFDDHKFGTQEPIGGEILAINTAALLIAGLTTSAIWMVPAIGAVAGTAVILYKLRQK